MTSLESSEELRRLQQDCIALEEEAGITEAMERAREGRFIPLGAFGEEASPDEYFADEHDHFRQRARDAYFSVEDLALRKQLIAAQRKIEGHIRRSLQADVIAADQAVSAAKKKSFQEPWMQAAVLGAAAVALGHWLFAVPGAIAGAVAGFFLGQGLIVTTRSRANTELSHAVQEFKEMVKAREKRALWPECFGAIEESTGARDELVDRESAYANVLHQPRGGG